MKSEEAILGAIRAEVLGTDLGQDSWLSVEELDGFAALLNLGAGRHLLEACCGTGGVSLYLARKYACQVTGIDLDEGKLALARRSASHHSLSPLVHFDAQDASQGLPYEDGSFDALLCVDSVHHLPRRKGVLAEWFRVLKPGSRLLYSDPMVITGAISAQEVALGSLDSAAIFFPPGENERLIAEAGFRILRREDLTGNAETLAGRWHAARDQHRGELAAIEGESRLESLQSYYATVQLLAHERRLSRFAFLAEKPLARIPGEIPGLSHPSSRTSALPFGRLV